MKLAIKFEHKKLCEFNLPSPEISTEQLTSRRMSDVENFCVDFKLAMEKVGCQWG